MARRKKPVTLKKGNDENKEMLQRRLMEEERLKGTDEMLYELPDHLDDMAKVYYVFIVKELKHANILCNLDKPTIEQASDCLSKIRQCDDIINTEGVRVEQIDRYGNKQVKEHPMIKTKHTYLSRYQQLSNSLGLDPASRASLAAKAVEANMQEQDELLKILRGSEDEDDDE